MESTTSLHSLNRYPRINYHRFLYLPMQNLIYSKETFLKPSTIILPQSKEQLANAILCCRRGSWTIRLRSGGHSFEGLSHIADTPFVIIDMMNLNQVSIDLDSKTAWIESGATLGEMYYAISQASISLSFPAGWCPTVGIGGHFSGGGFGLMTRKYGLAADNVVDALLVSSNGLVLDRKMMGEDVFWALRGGGGGAWGAVYAWKIQLLAIPEIVTAFKFERNGTKYELSRLLHKWQFTAPMLEDDFSWAVMVSADGNSSQPMLKFFGFVPWRRINSCLFYESSISRIGICCRKMQGDELD
ncbi:hypothetical protein IFM89_006936 [Coptis chinensis]|uniref:FAD-binding PCMH-type domain-containing protein n=1 Tax=Coptis chinensis TaxID=261450 RepID=A0A835HB20_9MAGN|nr:hypothetical protein IFM89_006936 [Coptis chinensis]